ncbi:hypothetical protein SAMN05421810_106288 [Amycolatopsis arida]|uniref:Uncharacterized protein n=1 Tax=Amycolatopsis arida TaxID=587909 RepID=A0A1I5XW60_9PSEU|nr:hypothetical protein [Amycolatopsis arida]TDX97231.1 hypothetical protein CLV69_102334 [Amycolatopsis arida]SFQ36136.1 hypothetical protein SAMN05421810_106288 [Amycolatopsis arida]
MVGPGQLVPLLLFALAGFLLGGVYSTWKRSRPLAVTLGVAAALAVGGAVAWLSG